MIETREQCLDVINKAIETIENNLLMIANPGDGSLPVAAADAISRHISDGNRFIAWLIDFRYITGSLVSPFKFSSITYQQLERIYEWFASRGHVLSAAAEIAAPGAGKADNAIIAYGACADEIAEYMARVRQLAPWVVA